MNGGDDKDFDAVWKNAAACRRIAAVCVLDQAQQLVQSFIGADCSCVFEIIGSETYDNQVDRRMGTECIPKPLPAISAVNVVIVKAGCSAVLTFLDDGIAVAEQLGCNACPADIRRVAPTVCRDISPCIGVSIA